MSVDSDAVLLLSKTDRTQLQVLQPAALAWPNGDWVQSERTSVSVGLSIKLPLRLADRCAG